MNDKSGDNSNNKNDTQPATKLQFDFGYSRWHGKLIDAF